eukprot:5662955-Amphidinium_carterae.1
MHCASLQADGNSMDWHCGLKVDGISVDWHFESHRGWDQHGLALQVSSMSKWIGTKAVLRGLPFCILLRPLAGGLYSDGASVSWQPRHSFP